MAESYLMEQKLMNELVERRIPYMKEKSLDERIAEFNEQTSLVTSQKVPPPYEVGDYVDVTITHIASYGAFVDLDDGEWSGLIHIKNIANQYIEDIHDFFQVGDRVEAKIIRIHKDFRIELSTLHLDLKSNNKFTPIPVSSLHHLKENMSVGEQVYQDKNERSTEEIQKIYNYLSQVVGILSPDSKEKVQKLVNEKGVFTFTIALVEALKVFEADLSYYLVKEIEMKLRDDL